MTEVNTADQQSMLEKVFAELIVEENPVPEQVSQLAAVILRRCKVGTHSEVLISRGKKALQLLEIIRRANVQFFIEAKKVLWTAVLLGWMETEGTKVDRDLFADAILKFRIGEGEHAFGAIFREIDPYRWLVCQLLERADKESTPMILMIMIRSVLRSVELGGDRDTLLQVAKLLS